MQGGAAEFAWLGIKSFLLAWVLTVWWMVAVLLWVTLFGVRIPQNNENLLVCSAALQ